jgi:hypothetical protein
MDGIIVLDHFLYSSALGNQCLNFQYIGPELLFTDNEECLKIHEWVSVAHTFSPAMVVDGRLTQDAWVPLRKNLGATIFKSEGWSHDWSGPTADAIGFFLGIISDNWTVDLTVDTKSIYACKLKRYEFNLIGIKRKYLNGKAK